MRTIADVGTTRRNNFTALRFVAASAVIWFHSFALKQQPRTEPLLGTASPFDTGFLSVLAFFVISGFLVTKSYDERRSPLAFVAARALRIYPGLAAAVLLTVVIGAVATTLPLAAFASHDGTIDYLLTTITGWRLRDTLPGAFETNPYPRAVNGSLWTLPLELALYVGCLAAGLLTLLQRRWLFNACFALGVATFAMRPEWFPLNPGLWVTRQLGLAFAVGAFAWVNRRSVPINAPLMAATVLAMFVLPSTLGRDLLFVPLFAYLILGIALHPRLAPTGAHAPGDYSYGLYIYAFPIQQAVIMAWPSLSPEGVFVATFGPTLAVAAASWHFIESPALRLKGCVSRLLQPNRVTITENSIVDAR